MSLSELQSMLSDVKRGGTLTGGTKVKKSGVTMRAKNKTSRMEGPNAAAHGLDGVLYHSRNKSLYGGDFQGAGFEGGGFEGGMVIGGFAPLVASLASAFAPMLIGSVAKALRGSGSNGTYSKQEVDETVGGAVHDLQPVLTRVAERLAKRGRGAGAGAGACKCKCKCTKGGMMRGIGEVVHTGGPSAMGKHLGASRGGTPTGGALTGGDFQGSGFETGAGGYAKGKGGKKPKSASRSASAKERAKSNPWLQHVAKVRAQSPGMAYKDVLRKAKESY
jgi:hypothetical protein